MRILVVEDDSLLAAGLVKALTRAAHAVDHTATGIEADLTLGNSKYDLVVLDIGLPGLDGFEVLRRIRENAQTSDLPVVLLSVRVGIQDQIDGWRAGADEYLTKPFSPSALAAKLYEICRMGPRDRADTRAERVVEQRVPLQSA